MFAVPGTNLLMRWRARSIRAAGEFPPDREAALRPVSGLGGVDLAGAGPGPSGLGSVGVGASAARSPAPSGPMPFESAPARRRGWKFQRGKCGFGATFRRGWGSRRYGNPGPGQLGPGSGYRQHGRTQGSAPLCESTPRLDPGSDAAIMLRAGGGRRGGIQFSGGKVPPGHDSLPLPDGA